jgi:hypothetical protein
MIRTSPHSAPQRRQSGIYIKTKRMRYRKYLERQIEPEAQLVARELQTHSPWGRMIGVPSCGEYELVWPMLDSIKLASSKAAYHGRTLCCLLINESPDTCTNYKIANEKLRLALQDEPKANFGLFDNFENINLYTYDDLDLLCITRIGSSSLPKGQGVGLARKILADIALVLYHDKKLSSQWIHQTDADAKIPEDYFEQAIALENKKDIAALVYSYTHTGLATSDHDEPYKIEVIRTASILYETWLRYYTLGLKYAGSPYAYPTIGSTITINAHAYGMIHGFPKRQAGEDFYLLNKLAKIGEIKVLNGNAIELTHRISARVPFGTGKATGKIASLIHTNSPYLVHDPLVFSAIKSILTYCADLIEEECKTIDYDQFTKHFPNSLDQKLADIFDLSKDFGIFDAHYSAMIRANTKRARQQHFHCWFDSFKTMRFIHLLSQQSIKDIRLEEAIEKAIFLPIIKSQKPLNTLNHLRNLDP